MIQGGQQARQEERRIEGRRQGERHAEPARRRGQDGDQRTRVVKGRVLGVAQIGIHPPLVGARHGQAVPQHDQVELGALEGDRHILPELWRRPIVPTPGLRARPAIQAEPGMGAERAKPHQMHLGHGCSRPPARASAPIPGPRWCGHVSASRHAKDESHDV